MVQAPVVTQQPLYNTILASKAYKQLNNRVISKQKCIDDI